MTERLDAHTLYRLLERRADAGAIFVDFPDARYSYRALVEDVQAWCAVFDARGLAPSSHVLILTRDERTAIGAFVATILDGHAAILLAPQTPPLRARAFAALTKPALAIVDQSALPDHDWTMPDNMVGVPAQSQGLDGILRRLWRGPAKSAIQTLAGDRGGRPPRCNAAPDDLAYILFTSGTTASPKGVMITHRNLFAHLATLSRVFGYDNASALFNGIPLAHGDGLVQGPLLTLANGCRLIRPPEFSPSALDSHLNGVRAKRATHFIAVPTVYRFIDRYARHDDYFEAEEFVALVSVAAKLDASLWRRLEERFRRPVYDIYGLTETVAGGLFAGPGLGPIGTIGRPVDVDVRLVDARGHDARDGEIGEIWLRGENVSPGYFADPAATAEKFEAGWLRTGDLAVRGPDGAYDIRGRIKSVIMYGGFQINPDELDEALMSHPAVAEAASVGLADDDFGEIAVSAVVLRSVADEFELTEHCHRLLEPRKIPKRIVVLPSIPRGPAGKPLLDELRALIAARMQDGAAPAASDLAGAILNIASQTFRVPLAELSLDSSPETVARWDSFAHISLILGVETQLQKRLSTSQALAIENLRQLLDAVSHAP